MFKSFFETFGQKLTICDIQPEYQQNIHFDMREFAKLFHECLSEVLILAEAMNVRLNVIDEFVYGR